MLIFQRLYLLSFIKKCSKNFSLITESNKVLKSGIQTTSHQEEKKNANISNVRKHFILQGFHSPFINQEVSSALLRLFENGRPFQISEFLKHCWDSVGQARAVHPPEMGARAHPPNAHSTPCQGRQHSDYSRLW